MALAQVDQVGKDREPTAKFHQEGSRGSQTTGVHYMRQNAKRRTLVRVKKPKVDRFKYYDLVIYAARGSTGARRLATALGSRRWRDDLPERYTRRRPYFRGNSSPLVLNWGSTVHPRWLEDPRFRLSPVWGNRAEACQGAINKLEFFRRLSENDKPKTGIPLLRWTTDREVALKWLDKKDCKGIVARTKLTGSSGQGIVLSTNAAAVPSAPLYTRVYPKTHEFRVHVFNGKVIDLTQKKLKGGPSDTTNRFVRSHGNGWVHAHDAIDLLPADKEPVGSACIASVRDLSLLFGAVDVLSILGPPDADSKRRMQSFVICEVNTGPGLENTVTIEAYKNAILEYRNEVKSVQTNS